MENVEKTANEIKNVFMEKIEDSKRIDELMYEAIKLIPYLNSHRTLHRRYRAPMITVINAALKAANNKLIELKVYDELNNTESSKPVVLNEVNKEIPREN